MLILITILVFVVENEWFVFYSFVVLQISQHILFNPVHSQVIQTAGEQEWSWLHMAEADWINDSRNTNNVD